MKLHDRVMPCQKARLDISTAVLEAVAKHPDLTYLEVLMILNEITGSDWIKYAIRQERHPDDPNKRGSRE